jgi:hypothetical protein
MNHECFQSLVQVCSSSLGCCCLTHHSVVLVAQRANFLRQSGYTRETSSASVKLIKFITALQQQQAHCTFHSCYLPFVGGLSFIDCLPAQQKVNDAATLEGAHTSLLNGRAPQQVNGFASKLNQFQILLCLARCQTDVYPNHSGTRLLHAKSMLFVSRSMR